MASSRPADTHVHGPDCSHDQPATEPIRRAAPKVGRNDPCLCGSGRKYKKCHGAAVADERPPT
jgi:preprotein translocase subunit SecA